MNLGQLVASGHLSTAKQCSRSETALTGGLVAADGHRATMATTAIWRETQNDALWAGVASSGLGLYAAPVKDLDGFISDLRRQSRWASWAAAFAGISVLAQLLEKLLK